MEVTRESLASALEGFYVAVRTGTGTCRVEIADPDVAADALYATLSRMAALREPEGGHAQALADTLSGPDQSGPLPHWIEITRDELASLLAKLRLGIEQAEEWRFGPTAMLSRPEAVADAIAAHARGLRQNESTDDVVDAHICCEHVGIDDAELIDDPELAAMAALLPALPKVAALGPDARERVMDWARRRATDRLPPF